MIFRPLDKVHNDEEVAGEAHLCNRLQLKIQAFPVVLLLLGGKGLPPFRGNLKPLAQPLMASLPEEFIHGLALRHRILWQVRLTQFQHNITTPRDLHTVFQRLRQIRKQSRHFLRRTQILLRGVASGPARIIQSAPFANTHPGLVGLEFIRVKKAYVVCSHYRALQLFCEGHCRMKTSLLRLPATSVQL